MASKYLYSAPFVAFALSFDLFSSSSLALHLRAATDAPSTGGEAFLSQHYLQATEGLDIPLDSHPSFLQTGFWKKKRGGEGRKRERERTPSPSRPRPEPDEPSPSTSGYDLPYTRQAEAALANLEADDDPFKNLPTGSLSLPSDPYGAPSESAGPSGTGSLGRTAGRGIKVRPVTVGSIMRKKGQGGPPQKTLDIPLSQRRYAPPQLPTTAEEGAAAGGGVESGPVSPTSPGFKGKLETIVGRRGRPPQFPLPQSQPVQFKEGEPLVSPPPTLIWRAPPSAPTPRRVLPPLSTSAEHMLRQGFEAAGGTGEQPGDSGEEDDEPPPSWKPPPPPGKMPPQ